MIKISIVIPTRHRNEHLKECLNLLAPDVQTYPKENYEIIVSDDGSTSTAENLIKENYPWVKWVAGPRKGPAANRNNGVRYSQFDWIAFTDDDCLPDKNWLQAYSQKQANFLEENIFEGKTAADRPQERYNEVSPINTTGGLLWSCNLMVRKSYYFKIGGYSEDFKFELEDIEFRTRVIKDGQQLVFTDKAYVCHPWRKIDNNYKVAADSVLIFLKKHPDHIKYYSLITRLKIIIMMSFQLLKNLTKYKSRGLKYALVDIAYELKSAFLIQAKITANQKKF
ncbi:glycosyltransferase family 2 protein [Zunongwangia sp.]|uniref:glycosyltransferase family 2 protein n=1 Tax=Zunongwangia sp. TaxID=1965325 RepID=UPI003AA95E7C